MDEIAVVSCAEYPALLDEALGVIQAGWGRFWVEDPVSKPLWSDLIPCFADFHFGLLDVRTNQLAGVGLTAPLAWNGAYSELLDRGWHWVLQQSLEDLRAGLEPHTLSAINAVILPSFRGRNLAETLVREMHRMTQRHGLRRFIAPLRPTQKEQYPLMSIEDYMDWRRPDGSPFDAWLRLQTRMGAEIVGAAERSIIIESTLEDWSDWTGLQFPYSGEYIIPGGAVPLQVDTQTGRGVLVSPSIWIKKDL